MALLLLLLSWPLLATPDAQVPSGVQAVMFRKIVSYDKVLAARKPEEINVCVAYDNDKAAAEEIGQAFRAAGFKAAAIELATVPRHLKKIDILYLFSDKDAAKLGPAVRGVGVLSISGEAALAESGAVSIGLGLDPDGKPRIFVNLKKLEEDGHALAASLLALARITR